MQDRGRACTPRQHAKGTCRTAHKDWCRTLSRAPQGYAKGLKRRCCGVLWTGTKALRPATTQPGATFSREYGTLSVLPPAVSQKSSTNTGTDTRCRCCMELDTPKDPRQATVGSLQWPANVNHSKADPRTHAGTAEQHRHLVASPRAAPIRRRPALTASHGIWPLQERNHAREVAPTTNNEADEHWDIPPHRGTQHPLRLLLPIKGTTALHNSWANASPTAKQQATAEHTYK